MCGSMLKEGAEKEISWHSQKRNGFWWYQKQDRTKWYSKWGFLGVSGSARQIYGSILLQTDLNMSTQAHRKFIKTYFIENEHLKIISNFHYKSFCLEQTQCFKMAF
jgi:hypothetical protein